MMVEEAVQWEGQMHSEMMHAVGDIMMKYADKPCPCLIN